MSGEIVTFVSQRKLGSPTRKAVIVQFAETANGSGKGIWKSHKTIASLTEVSSRTVQRTIKDFVAEGLVVHVGYNTSKGVTTKAYDLDLVEISKLPLVESESGFTPLELAIPTPEIESGQNGTYDTESGFGDTDDIKPASGVTLTVPTALTVHSINARESVGVVFACWNRMASDHGLSLVKTNVMNATRQATVVKRLQDCGGDIDQLRQAITNVPNNPHWLGSNNSGWKANFDWVFKTQNFPKVLEFDQPAQPKAQHDRISNNTKSNNFSNIGERRRQRRGALLESLEIEAQGFRGDR